MEELKRKELYKELMETFGYHKQMHVAVEEMAELTNALMKRERGRASDDEVIDEVADVIICMEQLARYFGVDKCVAAKLRKLLRLEARLETYLRQQERREQANMAATETDGTEESDHEREGDGDEQPKTAAGGDDPGPRGEMGHVETDGNEQPCTAADGDDNMLND